MKANIFVTLKREVLDPQGDAVRRSLSSADSHIQSMCERLLANPVIEDFHYEILD